jgi:predicted nucleic acid-binding protein
VIRDVLVDTGPLLAFIDRRDQYHAWVRSRFGEIQPPLQTCDAVLTEACFLARRLPAGVPAILGLFERGVCALTYPH